MQQTTEQAPKSTSEEASDQRGDDDREQCAEHPIGTYAAKAAPADGMPAGLDRRGARESSNDRDARAHGDPSARQKQRKHEARDAARQICPRELSCRHPDDGGHRQRHRLAREQTTRCVHDEREGHRAAVGSPARGDQQRARVWSIRYAEHERENDYYDKRSDTGDAQSTRLDVRIISDASAAPRGALAAHRRALAPATPNGACPHASHYAWVLRSVRCLGVGYLRKFHNLPQVSALDMHADVDHE